MSPTRGVQNEVDVTRPYPPYVETDPELIRLTAELPEKNRLE